MTQRNRHVEASRGLFATAELVDIYRLVKLVCLRSKWKLVDAGSRLFLFVVITVLFIVEMLSECHGQLSAEGFYLHKGDLYCTADYQSLFGVRCSYCSQFVAGEVVSVLQHTYHDVCFCCTVCRQVRCPSCYCCI